MIQGKEGRPRSLTRPRSLINPCSESWDLHQEEGGAEETKRLYFLPPIFGYEERVEEGVRGGKERKGYLFLLLVHVFKMCYKGLRQRRKERRSNLRPLKYNKTLAGLAEIVSAHGSAITSRQPTLCYFQGPGRCVGIILELMLTTTVKIATSTDMCLHLVSRKYSV